MDGSNENDGKRDKASLNVSAEQRMRLNMMKRNIDQMRSRIKVDDREEASGEGRKEAESTLSEKE